MFITEKKQQAADTASRLVVGSNQTSSIAEQFRTIRTNIQFSMVDRKIKTIVITSARQGAGKSFTAANLAVTLASEDKRILLVDADLRKPTVHTIFRKKNNQGLTTLLTDDQLSADSLIQYSVKSHLYLLPSGAVPPNPSELLNSNRMDDIMKELENSFDMIIYDMPPVLAVTDAQIMASKVEGTIFVIPKGRVSQDDTLKAKKLLAIVGANVLGAILNRVEKTDNGYYYTQ